MYGRSLAFPRPILDVDLAIPLPVLFNLLHEHSNVAYRMTVLTLDASRNGMRSETPSLSSMNTFIPVHIRMSPGLNRGVGVAFAYVGGKNACWRTTLEGRQ